MDTSIKRKHFVDPATGEQLAIGTPQVKEADKPVAKGTGMTPATPVQLTGLLGKFAK